MKNVLLHVCCGICAYGAIEKLRQDDFLIEGLFFNPNIHPQEEYLRRLEAAKIVAKESKIALEEGLYSNTDWFKLCQSYREEKEGALRCELCYELRLKETYQTCLKKSLDFFATTLSISPHKNTVVINEIGKRISSDKFLVYDFKKEDGFAKSVEVAKRLGLYRQNYCGCIYSREQACLFPTKE